MNPLQRAVFRRKVIYFAVILGLFTLSMFWRGVIPIPLVGKSAAADSVASRTILNQSIGLELREVEQGEQEVEGEAFRLALVGSRGLLVAYLWHSAIDAQKRNDFHRMESLVGTVTQLQPHFITPWVFQSWNIAYNVSVEMQGSGDMYYYIARGIDLLAEGERRQGRTDPETGRRLGSPDMRYWIAFTYQNKFGVSDNVEVLRCLFQLSCISPDDRNPDELEETDGRVKTVNARKFREFCEKYPHLVRRLRGEDRQADAGDEQARKRVAEALKCPRPEDVVQFLRDNKDVPSRYKFRKELAEASKQFPILPPRFSEEEAHPASETKDDFSAFKAARAWFAYSLVPLPDQQTDSSGKPVPAGTPQPGEYDPVKYRVPRQPMLIIFRQGVPRVQTYQAEMEQKEGWFDDEGWRIDDPADDPRRWWFPDPDRPSQPLPVVVGGRDSGAPPWSLEAWRKAAQLWSSHGERYGLVIEPARLQAYEATAARIPVAGAPPDPTPEQLADPQFREWYEAANAVFYYGQNRHVTNFPFFLASSSGEARVDAAGRPVTVLARKALWQAEQARKLGNKPRATALYRDGLEQWKRVLAADKQFHRPERSDRVQEETYQYELAYLRLLVQDDQDVRTRAAELARRYESVLRLLPLPAPGVSVLGLRDAQEEFKWYVAEKVLSPFAEPMGEKDGVTDERRGTPWVPEDVKQSVRQSMGLVRKPTQTGPPGSDAVRPPGDGP